MPDARAKIEHALEILLFSSRWLLAPFYLGMALALAIVLFVFGHEFVNEVSHLKTLDAEGAILFSLSLIDLSLTGNLLIIVMFAGYENFVSKMRIDDHEDKPGWMGTVNFSGLKLKLIASIVAISGIALLRAFLPLGDSNARVDSQRIGWMLAIHLTFVVSGVLLALMDWITAKIGENDAH